ncbi:hypothetical protein E1H12_15310 [Geitlerinema sp. P-1104]|jgi:hypothetical protein|uniref:hypothetical protein n=1 Tax=Cyanophyceae TaxID=3028117 RepID=UPI001214FABA|nr:hypothetical protein [Geitlerinema sp. P-1104]NMG59847.1 hypothetical protein [Geitlerinema sp. P-1104]TAN86962.1 MAG: hypothetical protein EYR95_16835 [Phormidium sp. SL48-SHIP]
MGNICIIGPRASGKTTYLAGLSHFSDLKKDNNAKTIYEVIPVNEDSKELKLNAENIIQEGLSVEPTRLGDGIDTVDDLPYYSFVIEVKRKFWQPKASIQLNVRDYPGEVFEKIIDANEEDSIHEEFIDECLMPDVTGGLLLFTEWESSSDRFYSQLMARFLEMIDERGRLQNYRLAVAMSKCERGEIWPGRLDPEIDLFGVYLKKTLKTLKNGLPPQNLRFFAMSTFGVLGKYNPRPNRVDAFASDGRASILRDPPIWKPYNLIEPLCWLNGS